MNLLVMWEDGRYSRLLEGLFGEGSVVTSPDQLDEKVRRDRSEGKINSDRGDYEGIILPVELRWGGRKLSHMYGVDTAKAILRARYQLKSPILFVSFYPLKRIIESPGHQLIVAVGHDHISMSAHPQKWLDKINSMEPLTDLQLTDVVTNLCNMRGLIGEVVHRVQGEIRSLLKSDSASAGEVIKARVKDSLDEIVNLLGKGLDGTSKKQLILRRFQEEIQAKNQLRDAVAFVERYGEELKSLVPGESDYGPYPEGGDVEDARRPLSWMALILDDEPESLKPVLEAFHRKGIKYHVVENVPEAEKIIEGDVSNNITVAVSDYRLFEIVDGVRKQQRRQGYDFLADLAGQDRFTGLIALSGLGRRFLLESFQKYSSRVAVFSKNDLGPPEALNLFADGVLDLGNETYNVICSQPHASSWQNLRPFYRAHRGSSDYKSAEHDIGKRARTYALKVEEVLNSGEALLIQNPPLVRLTGLTTEMSTKDPADHDVMGIFRNKLTARRIALWLYVCKGFKAIRIYAVLTGTLHPDNLLQSKIEELRSKAKGEVDIKALERKGWDKLDSSTKALINTHLALSLSDFPSGLLVEEKRWLKSEMGIDIYDIEDLLVQVGYHIKVALEEWCGANPARASELSVQTDLLTGDGSPLVTTFADAKRILKIIYDSLRRHSSPEEKRHYNLLINLIQSKMGADKYCARYLREFSAHVGKFI